jgi:hypothetical protein
MRARLIVLTLGLVMSVNAGPAAAQRRTPRTARTTRTTATRVPDSGMVAIGGSIGASLPTDASFKNGLELAGSVEGYVTPRVSVRGQLGATWWDITGRGFTGTVKPVFVDGNIVYNWEGGAVHPYVTAGLGLYHYNFDIPAGSGSDNKLGADLGGGVELFFTRHSTVTGEVLYHAVSNPTHSPVADFNPRFWTLAAGLKHYF